MVKKFLSSKTNLIILIPIIIAIAFIIFSIMLVIIAYDKVSYWSDASGQTYEEHGPRIEEAFSNFALPLYYEPVASEVEETQSNFTTNAITAEAQTFKVDMNMQDTKDELVDIINREEEFEAYEKDIDVRLSMHQGYLGSDDFIDKCSPAQIPIKSGTTFMTVILSDSFEDALIKFDGEGRVCNLKGTENYGKYSTCVTEDSHIRGSCETENEETFVTIVIWAM